jgi:hypothetical protein
LVTDKSRPVERVDFWGGIPNSAHDDTTIIFVPSLLCTDVVCNDVVVARCASQAFDQMPVPVVEIGELPFTPVTRTLARIELWKVCCPMPEEVGLGSLTEILETKLAVCPRTSRLVHSGPVQVEPLCISGRVALFVVVAFLCWTAKRLTCDVTHLVMGMR